MRRQFVFAVAILLACSAPALATPIDGNLSVTGDFSLTGANGSFSVTGDFSLDLVLDVGYNPANKDGLPAQIDVYARIGQLAYGPQDQDQLKTYGAIGTGVLRDGARVPVTLAVALPGGLPDSGLVLLTTFSRPAGFDPPAPIFTQDAAFSFAAIQDNVFQNPAGIQDNVFQNPAAIQDDLFTGVISQVQSGTLDWSTLSFSFGLGNVTLNGKYNGVAGIGSNTTALAGTFNVVPEPASLALAALGATAAAARRRRSSS